MLWGWRPCSSQPGGNGKRRKSAGGSQPSDKELQLSGLLYIMYLLANDEVRGPPCYARCGDQYAIKVIVMTIQGSMGRVAS